MSQDTVEIPVEHAAKVAFNNMGVKDYKNPTALGDKLDHWRNVCNSKVPQNITKSNYHRGTLELWGEFEIDGELIEFQIDYDMRNEEGILEFL